MDPAMAQILADGTHVRLRNRFTDSYLFASDIGFGVTHIHHRPSLSTAWLVHAMPPAPLDIDTKAVYFRLCGAAYGLYLARSREDTPFGHFLLRQRTLHIFDGEGQRDHNDTVWRGEHFDILPAAVDSSHIGFASCSHENFLNMHWIIEPIPLRRRPPALPPVLIQDSFLGTRPIMYVRANDQGRIHLTAWRRMDFRGHSLRRLRAELALLLNEEEEGITLCTWPGYSGRLTPLVVDLALNEDYMAIVVLTTRSPAARALRHPNVHAQQRNMG